MYCIIDDTNRSLPRHLTEEQYLVLPLATQVLYELQTSDTSDFVAGDGEPSYYPSDDEGHFFDDNEDMDED